MSTRSKGKWMLHIGIHRGTLMSRDSEPVKELDSLDECRSVAFKAFEAYRRLGCKCWFCEATSPKGVAVTIISPEPYN